MRMYIETGNAGTGAGCTDGDGFWFIDALTVNDWLELVAEFQLDDMVAAFNVDMPRVLDHLSIMTLTMTLIDYKCLVCHIVTI